jgi:hypothetical protein
MKTQPMALCMGLLLAALTPFARAAFQAARGEAGRRPDAGSRGQPG